MSRPLYRREPDRVAAFCGWILLAQPSPKKEDLAELDRLIVELCGLVCWLQRQEAELLALRRRMAPSPRGR